MKSKIIISLSKYLFITSIFISMLPIFSCKNIIDMDLSKNTPKSNISNTNPPPTEKSKTLLWRNKSTQQGNDLYRIPAFATTKDGTLIAVTDLRYDNNKDIGNHKIDLIAKRSFDFGKTWSSDINIVQGYTTNGKNFGYGDAAIVADYESNEVLILCAWGTIGFGQAEKLNVAAIRSNDAGLTWNTPEDITNEIYAFDPAANSLFFGSGRIVQSKKVKIGTHYRLYCSFLEERNNAASYYNLVIYSDDFGKNWKLLGSKETPPAGSGCNEPKVEELPDGRVLLSSRTSGGRLFNIYTYSNIANGEGSWETSAIKCAFGNDTGTNGEILILPVFDQKTKEHKTLAMQSIPAVNRRKQVAIYYRIIEDNITLTDFATSAKWSPFYVQEKNILGCYSTMLPQLDGTIGFLYEDGTRIAKDTEGYDIAYQSFFISTITGGKYIQSKFGK